METKELPVVWNIEAENPSGKGRRIQLVGKDLIFGGIDNIFVYPSLDVNRLKTALSRTLSRWPILTGRVFVHDDDYTIVCSDHAIPFTYVENDQLERWPTLPVIIDDMGLFQLYIDSTQYKPEVEPLLRFKLTYLIRSKEYVLGVSFFHLVGDADSNLHFLNDLSCVYQGLEPILPTPTFERHLFHEADPEFASSPWMKQFRLADQRESIIARLGREYGETNAVYLNFTSKQLDQLHQLAQTRNNSKPVTVHDALCAYIILALNKYYFTKEDEHIHRAHVVINFRGVSDVLAPKGQVANSIMQMLTSDFPECLSLSSIAQTIRQAIQLARKEEFLSKWVYTHDILMKQMIKENRVNFVWDADELFLNSNYTYDWASMFDFGMTNQCRVHTAGLYRLYFRIFRTNPIQMDDGHWTRDNRGAQVAFRLPKGEQHDKFLEAINRDIDENFINYQ